jgi:hypothetical protein
MITRRQTLGIGVGLASALVAGRAEAQAFPGRPINLIVMANAGGSTDVGARVVAAIAEKIAGQPIVVINKVGAGGQVGWTELARSKPDGYTIGFVVLPGMNTVVLDPERKATFTEDSFIPVANQVLDPGVLWVKADSPFKTFKDLIDAARKAPHTVRAATTGNPVRRSPCDPDDRGGQSWGLLPPGASRWQCRAAQGDAGRQCRRGFRQRGRGDQAGEVGAGAGADGDGRGALEVPAGRADLGRARLSDHHLELDARHHRAERHAA